MDADVDAVDLTSPENLQDINDISGVLKLWFRELPEPLMTYEVRQVLFFSRPSAGSAMLTPQGNVLTESSGIQQGYHGFIEAAKIENPRFLHIRTHERVNDLPDAHYACLKALMGHLHKCVAARELVERFKQGDLADSGTCAYASLLLRHSIQKHGSVNSMNMSNLAIVFGPTLFRPPPGEEANALADMSWQCKSIETILTHYEACVGSVFSLKQATAPASADPPLNAVDRIFVPSEEDEAEQHHQQQDQQSEA